MGVAVLNQVSYTGNMLRTYVVDTCMAACAE
jgi:hypothetical protein